MFQISADNAPGTPFAASPVSLSFDKNAVKVTDLNDAQLHTAALVANGEHRVFVSLRLQAGSENYRITVAQPTAPEIEFTGPLPSLTANWIKTHSPLAEGPVPADLGHGPVRDRRDHHAGGRLEGRAASARAGAAVGADAALPPALLPGPGSRLVPRGWAVYARGLLAFYARTARAHGIQDRQTAMVAAIQRFSSGGGRRREFGGQAAQGRARRR